MWLSRITDKIHRSARRRGFGVHSPFAFSFLADVIRQENSYYAYERINAFATGRHRAEFLRLVFRVAVTLKCKRFTAHGTDVMETLKLAGAEESQNPDILVVDCDTKPEQALQCAAEGGVIVFDCGACYDNGTLKQIADMFDYGMFFSARSYAVFVARKGLPKQWFDV